MGTSAAYDAPSDWSALKGDVTRSARAGSISSERAHKILREFISANGGARSLARGAGGGSAGNGRAARTIATRLATFFSSAGIHGFTVAIRESGMSDLIGKPVQLVLAGLLDKLGGDCNTIDEVDARAALSKLLDKYLGDAEDAEAVNNILNSTIDLGALIIDYFGFYLFELFSRVFFERLVQRAGEANALSYLNDIEQFIYATLSNRTSNIDIANIDWTGTSGQALISEIMQTTLDVFGGEQE